MTTINLSKAQEVAFTHKHGGQLYYIDGAETLALTPTGERGSRYVDADDDRDRVDPKGEGRHLKTREYMTAPVTPEQAEIVRHAQALALLAGEFRPGYLDSLPKAERAQRVQAEHEARQSGVRGYGSGMTRRAVRVDGVWTTEAIPEDRADDEDDRL
ncbi:hypothetical protein [uncultured Deinococcus sp.]|uniref:hypothetical protein n=1 Tax=uncultured Deinococcus sp. TaxID=158789 RepID=UPI00258DC827|nr:hypothetical protein [uncultured Deinococcus sp.]